MIPFRLTFQPGIPVHEQVTFAAKKAMIAGQLRTGDAFPSVRALSKAMKINPNTAHKVIAELTQEGLLEALNEARVRGVPVLGICLGMQLMANRSEEGDTDGLGWLDAKVVRFRVGDTVPVEVLRDGTPRQVSVPVTGYDRTRARVVEIPEATPAQIARRQRWLSAAIPAT